MRTLLILGLHCGCRLWKLYHYIGQVIFHVYLRLILLKLQINLGRDIEALRSWDILGRLLIVYLDVVNYRLLLGCLNVVVVSSLVLVIQVVVGLVVEPLHGELVLLRLNTYQIITTVPPASFRDSIRRVVALIWLDGRLGVHSSLGNWESGIVLQVLKQPLLLQLSQIGISHFQLVLSVEVVVGLGNMRVSITKCIRLALGRLIIKYC